MTEEAQAAPVAEEATPEATAGEGSQEQQPSGAETLLAKDTGEKPDENSADDAGEKEGNTESQDDEAFELTVSEEFAGFSDDFKAFQDDMAGWLKENPKAGVKEALQEAANRQAKAVAKAQSDMQEAFKSQVEAWEKEAKALPEIGGDKFEENLSVAKQALDAFGSPELTKLLNQSGYGSHPAVISMFVKAGAALKSAPVATNEKPGVGEETALRNRYPSSSKE